MVKIDKVELFKETLKSGINIFAGAGFSTLLSPSGNKLPLPKELSEEICDKYKIDKKYDDDLEMLSGLVNTRSRQDFQAYLRQKYTVNEYNNLYNALDLLNIRSFITTNIDNLIQCVFDNSKRHYLQNTILRGATKNYSEAVTYIPLHGEVNNLNTNLYFGKNELANVDSDNKMLFDTMHAELLKAPVLFWGYGFHDAGVNRIISSILENRIQTVWVQCLPSDSKNIEYFRALGCNVIEANTENLLLWFKSNVLLEPLSDVNYEVPKVLEKYLIPTINKLATVSKNEYFLNAETDWYCILADYPSETSYVDTICEMVLKNKNSVIVGIPFSGKTTLLMQVAKKFNSSNPVIKLFISECTPEHVRLIVNNLGDKQAIIFIDNFCADIEAAKILMQNKNIRVVCIDDDYTFETSKHIIENVEYKKFDFGELSISDSQRIYEKIPHNIRNEKFNYKSDTDKFSMFEMMGNNIDKILSDVRIEEILRKIEAASSEAFEIVALASYLSANRSALSTDILFSYFETTDYKWIQDQITCVKNYLSEIDVPLTIDDFDQDYYNLRSRLFIRFAFKILRDKFKQHFAHVVRKFIIDIPPYKIYNHYVFKRKGYDAYNFYRLFDNNALDLYEIIYKYEPHAFTLQQMAMYKLYIGDFSGAYLDIENATNQLPHNFSMKNARAKILFDANKDIDSKAALGKMKEAMSILESCIDSDKRKIYHAQDYAKNAIFLAEEKSTSNYLEQALLWLKEIIENAEVQGYRKRELCNLIKKIEQMSVKN